MRRSFAEEIEVRNNVSLIARSRGKIVARREGHNIWLNLGREYLAQLIAYTSMSPLIPERDDRIRFMGLGVGGTKQLAPGTANSSPIGGAVSPNAYAGTNSQTDTDPTVIRLERPVRIAGSTIPYPGLSGDVWLGQVQAPATHSSAPEVTFKRLFTQLDVNYGIYQSVPLCEVMLFTNAADPLVYNNTGVAYETFDTLSKTDAFDLEVSWTVRF